MVKGASTKLTICVQSLRLTWRRDRTNSYRLSLVSAPTLSCTCVHMHAHTELWWINGYNIKSKNQPGCRTPAEAINRATRVTGVTLHALPVCASWSLPWHHRGNSCLSSEIRAQLVEQQKCLEQQTEMRVQLLQDLQDFFRKKAEIETEYSRNLEKLAERFMAKTRSTKDHQQFK